MTEDSILHSVSELTTFFGRLIGQSKVSALPRAHLEEVMNLQSNSPLMYFVIERDRRRPAIEIIFQNISSYSRGILVIAWPTEAIIV